MEKTLRHWIPRGIISALAGYAYRSRLSRLLIAPYIRRYGVKAEEIMRPVADYASLADFFSRELDPGLRPIAPGDLSLTSPVDGRIVEYGRLQDGRMIQAKGVDYTAAGLLRDGAAAERYEGGRYITIYLSPADYHRIHTPAAGTVRAAQRIPGSRWPVNETGVKQIKGLFERNERVVTYLDTSKFGRVAIVKVGAYIVGGIRVAYESEIDNLSGHGRAELEHSLLDVTVRKGEELGRFEFGSTVILLVEPGPFTWSDAIEHNARVRMGQPLLVRE